MINSLVIKNFKCFKERQEIKLAPVTLFYGKNGRGKSSVEQTLLLLGQTMRAYNNIETLSLTGEFVKLGTFEEIKSALSEEEDFRISLNTERENLELGFSAYQGRSQLARLTTFVFNGVDRLETKTTNDIVSEELQVGVLKSIGVTSDVGILQDLKSITYVSAGRRGPVNSSNRNDLLRPNWIGVEGENLINVLADRGASFIKSVERTLSEILSGAAINIPNPEAERIDLQLNSADGAVYFRPVNVGFGYSYVLPVVVAALLAEKGSILIVENPEAHLHPGAQSRLMKFLIGVAVENNLQILIETHSDHIVNGMRIAVKQQKLKPSDCIIVHFAHEHKDVNPIVDFITCDKNGMLNDYPDDFMDEWTQQMLMLV